MLDNEIVKIVMDNDHLFDFPTYETEEERQNTYEDWCCFLSNDEKVLTDDESKVLKKKLLEKKDEKDFLTVGSFIRWCCNNFPLDIDTTQQRYLYQCHRHFIEGYNKDQNGNEYDFTPSDKDMFYSDYLEWEYVKKLLPYKVEHLRSLII